MYLIKSFLVLILIFSCNTEPTRMEIEVGKTIKIEATNFNNESMIDNYNFLWSKPTSPNNNDADMIFKINNDKMLFTPYHEGNFDINLTIESLNKTYLYQEIFSYHAVNKGFMPSIQSNNHTDTNINNNKEQHYTIQIASPPTAELAKKYQIELQNLGYDTYTEPFYHNNKQYWRVRIGNFTNFAKGKKIENHLKELGYDTWFTNISY